MADEMLERRKGGRPRVVEPSGVRLSTYVRSPDYDRLLKLAKAHDRSVSGLVRDLLRLRLK